MAGRLNWAMEKMGWRVPADEDEETQMVAEEYPFAERPVVHERTEVAEPVAYTAPAVAESRQRIATVHPKSYADVMAVGESFRAGVPVIMNLTGMDDAEARRVVDFAAGLTFGLRGAIERVTTRVFLLSPADTHVSRDGGTRASESFR